jgi:DnaK suppressor protein
MDEATIEQFREKLTQRRQRILEQLGRNEEDLAWLEQSRSPEFSEEAQEETAANSLKALDHQERRELLDIQRALNKMDDGTYGECERCGAEIGLPRLSALPMARLCIKCQTKREGRK